MAFRFNYRDSDSPNRAGAGVGVGDLAPVRGTVDGVTAPIGTKPDFLSRDFYQARVFLNCKDGLGAEVPAGTADVQIWLRDMPEIGDANNVAPNPPAADKVAWVKGPEHLALGSLEEVVLGDIYKRGIYVQVTGVGGGATQADVFVAPFDRHNPFASVD